MRRGRNAKLGRGGQLSVDLSVVTRVGVRWDRKGRINILVHVARIKDFFSLRKKSGTCECAGKCLKFGRNNIFENIWRESPNLSRLEKKIFKF